jgi:hypothetical protein
MPRNQQVDLYHPYQVGAPPGARYQRLGGALLHAVRSESGQQLVQYARDAIGNAGSAIQGYYNNLGVQDRIRQSQRRDQEVPDEDFEAENMDYGGNGAAMGVQSSGPSGEGTNTGFRGSLTGRGQTNDSYERYYREGDLFHSKLTKTALVPYGLSQWQYRRDWFGTVNPLPFRPFPGNNNEGLVYTIVDNSFQNISDDRSIFNPWCFSNDFKEFNPAEFVLTRAINLSSNMLFDSKLTGGTKNLLNQYQKFRLHSFTIELQFETYHITPEESYPGFFESILNHAKWIPGNTISDYNKTIVATRKSEKAEKNEMKYLVYRDCDYIYTNPDGFIKAIPEDSSDSATQINIPHRAVWSVIEIDKNNSIISEHEKYSFTRKVNPQGNYFMDKTTVQGLYNNPISIDKLIGTLEGANATGTIVKPLVEGFNLLYAPINAHVRWYGPFIFSQAIDQNTPKEGIWIPLVQCSTKVTLTVRAEWEAWNYDYKGANILPQRIESEYSEPLEKLETDFKFTSAVNAMKKNN